MANFDTIRAEIAANITPNGQGKITGQVLQDILLGMTTPSGDPMHYNYLVVGAEYNDTNAPLTRIDYFGNSVTHLPGRWYLEGLGDLTNAEMRTIYEAGKWWVSSDDKGFGGAGTVKTNLPSLSYFQVCYKSAYDFTQAFNGSSSLHAIDLRTQPSAAPQTKFDRVAVKSMDFLCQGSANVKYIYGIIDASGAVGDNSFWIHTAGLVEVRLYGIKKAVKLPLSKNISKASILYMIDNEAATSAITITLHTDAYARLSADADIVAALAAHPKVSLAKA